MFDADDACLKCSLCVTACPVYREDPQFPGPKVLGPEWHRAALALPGLTAADHVDDCTFCQLCEAACPADVPVAHLIAHHKASQAKSPVVRLRDAVLARPHLMARAPGLAGLGGPPARWVGLSVETRRPRPQPLRWPAEPAATGARGIVALFVDCFTRAYDGGAAEAASRLLKAWGYAVRWVPRESRCCGAAAYAAGQPATARRIAAATAEDLEVNHGVQAIVTLNATCDGTLRDEWPRYFHQDVPAPVVPFAAFALAEAPPAFWDSLVASPSGLVFVHTTCRAKVSQGEGALLALARRAGADVVERLDVECCGAAGSYAFKAEHHGVAQRLGRRAAGQVGGRSGTLLVDSGTCALHLSQMTGLYAEHPARWLDQRRRGSEANLGRSTAARRT